MDPELEELHRILVEGQKLSGQGSYERRAPAKAAMPHLLEARMGLIRYTRDHQDDAAGWRLRSLAEEALLQYNAAVRSLERALVLSGTGDRKDLKRLANLKQAAEKWRGLMLQPPELEELGRFLDAELCRSPCGHTLKATRQWLHDRQISNSGQVLKAIQSHGGGCDCEVLANVVEG